MFVLVIQYQKVYLTNIPIAFWDAKLPKKNKNILNNEFKIRKNTCAEMHFFKNEWGVLNSK
jgi:hypothetical protein